MIKYIIYNKIKGAKNAKSIYFDKEFENEQSRPFWGIFFNTEKANFEIKNLLVNGEPVKATVNKYIRKGEVFDISTKANGQMYLNVDI